MGIERSRGRGWNRNDSFRFQFIANVGKSSSMPPSGAEIHGNARVVTPRLGIQESIGWFRSPRFADLQFAYGIMPGDRAIYADDLHASFTLRDESVQRAITCSIIVEPNPREDKQPSSAGESKRYRSAWIKSLVAASNCLVLLDIFRPDCERCHNENRIMDISQNEKFGAVVFYERLSLKSLAQGIWSTKWKMERQYFKYIKYHVRSIEQHRRLNIEFELFLVWTIFLDLTTQ